MNITGAAEVYGVIGFPIKHSLSPVFQNAAFSYIGIDAVYLPFEIKPENLKEAILGFRAIGVKGLNVTIPHKEAVLKLADFVSEEANSIGAANTLKFTDGRIEAYNTDWIGFLRAAEEITQLKGKKVLVLGAGGASRAVIYALKKAGAYVLLWNRTIEKAYKLSEEFGVDVVENVGVSVKKADVIVNTTSVGLKEDDKPIFDYSLIEERHTVIDIIYKETSLIKEAKRRGCKYQTGFPMLVYQGAESFRIWTGCEPPVKIMKLSLLKYGYSTDYSKTPLKI